jgi:NAD(P)-dependent dehydrogenase (short-subunit alcohol dehydrogenase family)
MPAALIIGASRGLGLGMAREWRGRGWDVVATRRGPAADLEATGADVRVADMDDAAAMAALAASLSDRSFDVVLINAGVSGPKATAHEVTRDANAADSWGALFWTNALAPVRAARLLEPLVAPTGVLALMTSIMGSVALRTYAFGDLYSASKAALNSFTRGLAAEHPARTIISLHPGWVKTDMGGAEADLAPAEAVASLRRVIAAANASHNGKFLNYTGEQLPW